MNLKTGSQLAVWLVAIGALFGSIAIYIVAYIGLSVGTSRSLATGGTCRVFRQQWQAMLFIPACLAEGAATGKEVSPAWLDATVGVPSAS